MPKLILGIAGEIGSGKGLATKHIIQNYQANKYRFSDMLRDVLNRLYLDQSRENIAKLSLMFRKTFGENIIGNVTCRNAYEDKAEIVVVDGIRRMEDMQHLKEIAFFKLLYIEADLETRYERIKKRRENSDEQGEQEKTFEEFCHDHELETELGIRDLKNYADYVVDNNGTYVEFYAKIDEVLKENI